MSEKRFIEDFSYLINYPKHHCVFDGMQQKDLELDEIVALLNQLYDENRELRQTIIEMRQDEQLYAMEIVKLNKEVKDNQFLRLGNDY